MTKRRERKSYTEEFKNQIVKLYNYGKKQSELIKEYDLTSSSLSNWIKKINKTGSSKEKDNKTEEQIEIINLYKKIKQLEMENDILKQVALIMGRK